MVNHPWICDKIEYSWVEFGLLISTRLSIWTPQRQCHRGILDKTQLFSSEQSEVRTPNTEQSNYSEQQKFDVQPEQRTYQTAWTFRTANRTEHLILTPIILVILVCWTMRTVYVERTPNCPNRTNIEHSACYMPNSSSWAKIPYSEQAEHTYCSDFGGPCLHDDFKSLEKKNRHHFEQICYEGFEWASNLKIS